MAAEQFLSIAALSLYVEALILSSDYIYSFRCFIEAKGSVKISGVVTDSENEPLEFVTVKIKGTAIGTITEAGGRYSLTAPEADTIRVIFSCIGFEESSAGLSMLRAR